MNKWYTYHLIDPRNQQVFYVGKGHARRMYVHRTRALKWKSKGRLETRNTNQKLYNKILSIVDDGFDIEYQIVRRFEFEKQALDYEEEEIARIGLDKLANLTKGGEGEQKSPEVLEKMSASLRLFWDSEEGLHRRKEFSEMRMGEKNPMYGFVEDDAHKRRRMKNMLEKPRWNVGLAGDIRCKGPPKGTIPHNAKSCLAISLVSNEIVRAESVARLASKCGIPLVTLTRMLEVPGYNSRKWSNVWKVSFE